MTLRKKKCQQDDKGETFVATAMVQNWVILALNETNFQILALNETNFHIFCCVDHRCDLISHESVHCRKH